jgi:hypothetical protein
MANTILNQAVLNKIRKNKYILVLNLPPVLKGLNSNVKRANELLNLDALQYSVYGVLVPKTSIPAIPLNVKGQVYNVTSQTRAPFNSISVFFNIDNLMNNYWVLWKWLEILNHPVNSGMNEYFAKFVHYNDKAVIDSPIPISVNDADNPREIDTQVVKMVNDYTAYQTIISVFMENEYNQKIARIDYSNAFITDLSEVSYNNRDPSEAEAYFTFSFNQMTIELLDIEPS